MKIGLDVGSTTVKCVVVDENNSIVYKNYERHYSQIKQQIIKILKFVKDNIIHNLPVKIAISGSAGIGIADSCKIPFVQEVYATKIASNIFSPKTDVIIELGGEDAKILFLSDQLEVRMNGSCAGGTGAFIDQMATLLNVSVNKINDLAKSYKKIYTIASRCGVFAKSDIQPLLNQGANRADIAASIFVAVVNQTIAGLAQGREIQGNILYLGGPLTFLSELRKYFDKTLKTQGICPENSLYYVALGAAICADRIINLDEIINEVETCKTTNNFAHNKPLFENLDEYKEFKKRHNKNKVKTGKIKNYKGKIYIGLDIGSTTAKAAVIGENCELLHSVYMPNKGEPVNIVKEFLEELYIEYPNLEVASSAVTGYGEDLIKSAFSIDFGIVETVAHLTAAQNFMPDVEFIIDIGGQDIKCFKVRSGVIDNIFLNEACSSGCGSFLQTFANALGYSIEEFSRLGLFAKAPVDLGSRCTVFMNSSVKQAQKDGATIEDISAGLSISVVKNALYKVIRAFSPKELGENIVVQGGTFLNDAVLRAFELEVGAEVVRPDIAGLMGAYGSALYAKRHENGKSSIINLNGLKNFSHEVKYANCGGCGNNCKLTVNKFNGQRRCISGNKCEKPITGKSADDSLNMYAYKLSLLHRYKNFMSEKRATIGLPFGLNMYEMLPFWYVFFSSLGFGITTSPVSNREIYLSGQHTVPSDTVCYPAKLMHGHIEALLNSGVKYIFYPCMSYNFDEKLGDNHYNCPVVAYYPEVIAANVKQLDNVTFINDYIGIHRPKDFSKKMHEILCKYFDGISFKEVKKAAKEAYKEYQLHINRIKAAGEKIIETAQAQNREIIVLAGRPYHVDPEVNHSIDKIIAGLGVAVVSEDVISGKVEKFSTDVLNQWTYHSRLYSAAKYISDKKNMNLVQLVSFGCGVDAITTDEIRNILEKSGKIYTQIKIDEITNPGAVKIRLRSLLAAIHNN